MTSKRWPQTTCLTACVPFVCESGGLSCVRGLGCLVIELTHCLRLYTTVSCCQKFAAMSTIFLSSFLVFFPPPNKKKEELSLHFSALASELVRPRGRLSTPIWAPATTATVLGATKGGSCRCSRKK